MLFGDSMQLYEGIGGRMTMMEQSLIDDMQLDEDLDTVQTTLYDLIAAINEDVSPDEDWIVTEAVLELLETNQTKFFAAN